MNQIAASASALARSGFGLAARLTVLAGVFVLEKLVLNAFVDFSRAQAAEGLGAWVRDLQHFGFRFLVTFAAVVALFAYVRGGPVLQAADTAMRAARLRWGWLLAHGALFACLVPLSYLLYRGSGVPLSLLVGLWLVIGVLTVLGAFLAMAPGRLWLDTAWALGRIWGYAAVAALLGTAAMQASQSLWAPTAGVTFDLVRRVLTPIVPTLTADSAARVISTGRFSVQIADVCSGLEGVGLMLAFSSAWLLWFRREYVFPRALVLIPASIVAIFALNVVRIAVLILIGNVGFPDVAQYGFHSQAGWIAFNAVACGIVLLSRRSTWLCPRPAGTALQGHAAENPTAAYLMPLLAILAAGTVSRALSSDFEFLYPLRVGAGFWMLMRYRSTLAALDWHSSWRGPACGAAVFLLWIGAAHAWIPAAAIPEKLAAMPSGVRTLWLVSRLTGGILIVPVAEEIAYRGYLMRRLCRTEFDSMPFRAVRWPALAVSAVIFGFAHGVLWLPGIIAGLAFGLLVMHRGRIGEAVAAHATANALIAAAVLGWNQWQLW